MSHEKAPATQYRMARRIYFSAAHRLNNPNFTFEENLAHYGAQATTHGLGHNYILEAYLEGTPDSRSAMLMPVAQIDSLLKEVVSGLDHKFLNQDVPYFHERLPTAENLAAYCYNFLSDLLAREASQGLKLQKVRLYETEDLWVDIGAQIEAEF